MENEEKEVENRRGGLEFIPLPAGRSEEDFKVSRGRSHPGQMNLIGDLLETVNPNGKRAGGR